VHLSWHLLGTLLMIHLGYMSIFEHLEIILRGLEGGVGCNSFDTILMSCLGFVGMFEN